MEKAKRIGIVISLWGHELLAVSLCYAQYAKE